MAASAARKLFAQASHYSIASLLTTLGGFVTFPLLTRLFSVREYGVMALISATLSVATALGKTGIQHSIVRYFTEISAGKSRYRLPQLYATAILGMVVAALVVATVLAVGGQLVPDSWVQDRLVRRLLVIVAVVVVIEVLDSAFINLLRADQRTTTLMKYQVAKKYLTLTLMIGGLLLIAPTLTTFYTATLLAEGTAVVVMTRVLFRAHRELVPSPTRFSRPLYLELLALGLPMTFGYELAGIILNVGDRYVIKAMIGEAPLGLYSAAYNMCQYVQAVFTVPIGQAITPLYMRMWDEEGAGATSAFVSRSLGNYFLMTAPIVAGVMSIGPELLPSLASDKYASAGLVVPWVISGMVIDGAATITGAGLFIHKRTRTIMVMVAGSAGINVAANVLLVPRLGILGAAISTLISYFALAVAFTLGARSFLAVRIPWATLARAVFAALVMFAGLHFLVPGRRFVTVGVRAVVGALVYPSLIVAIDADARILGKGLLERVRRRLGRRAGGDGGAGKGTGSV